MVASRLGSLGIGALTSTRYSDICAFHAIDRMSLARLALREMACGWNIEMKMRAARAGLRILEVLLPHRRRAGDQSRVAALLGGTLRTGSRIIATFPGVPATPGGSMQTNR